MGHVYGRILCVHFDDSPIVCSEISAGAKFAHNLDTRLLIVPCILQARMVAQGLTVLVLIASAGLSSIPTENGGENDNQIKQHLREDANFKWNKNSPHYLAAHEHDGEKKGEKKTGP